MAESASLNAAPLSEEQVDQFQRDGYLIVRQLLDPEETALLQQTVRQDQRLREHAMDVKDSAGRRTNLTLWNHPGDDIYGAIARSQRVAGAMEQLLGDEVYHYHSKLSAKEPRVGGAWEWHQDYGYWYMNGCLFPQMASVFVAIDPCTRENGCLQLLSGSHHIGRIEHGGFGEQTGADPERVEAAKQRLPLVHCLLEPGDALYFHSNTLHASDANQSEHARWGLLCCYNTRSNDPYKKSHHPNYTPLDKLPDSAIKQVGMAGTKAGQKFLVQEEDETTGGGRARGKRTESVSE